MAETTEEQNTQQNTEVFVLDTKSKLANRIDTLFFKWFDQKYSLIGNAEEQIDTSESLNELTKIVNSLLNQLGTSKEKSAVTLLNNLNSFLAGDSTAGVTVIGDRPQEDHISKLIWLINVTTTVSVLSGELAETRKTLDKGPLKKANVSAENIEKIIPAVKNSKQMKSPADFIGKELPTKFQAVAKHKLLARAVERRSRFTGAARPGEPHTIEQMYTDIGEALVYVSTSIFAEANRALTNQGQRIAADKVKNMDFKSLSAKEQDKLMQTLYNGFQQSSNYTAELNIFSSLNDKMILDSALAVWYRQLNDEQRDRSGFKEQDLYSLPKAIEFSRKYRTQFNSMYNRYSNRFVDGMTAALKKEQETVEKDWFENKITGERQYRRGRLAGHGNKFMHTPPMKWLNESLGKKSWASLWAIPKLGMLTLNILTNPTLRKIRKKLTGTLFAGIRSFAQGVAEGFTATGRSTEITYDDVIKKLKEAEEKLKKLTDDKTVVAKESANISDVDLLLLEDEFNRYDEPEDEEPEDDVETTLQRIIKTLQRETELFSKAISDESVKSDRQEYTKLHAAHEEMINRLDLRDRVAQLENKDSSKFTEEQNLLVQIGELLKQCDDDYTEFEQKSKDYEDDVHDAEEGGTLQVGEKTVKICEDVFDTLNKYIARQWNLLAAHSNHADMPLCVEYTQIELKDYVKAAAKKQTTSEMTFTDWLEVNKLFEDASDEKQQARQNLSRDSVAGIPNNAKQQQSVRNDREMRDNREAVNQNGQKTAEYPRKMQNGMYQYHGLEIKAAKSDNTKTGFGVLADRLIKIAGPVDDFCKYVEALGRDDAKKTFNNDVKEPGYNPKSDNNNKNLKSATTNPLESVFVTGYVLNEDIGNRVVAAADKATDAVGNAAKSGINWLGKGAGKGIGKVLHGITHTSTEDKDALMAKTALTYMYDRNLNTAYVRDGANILKKHCLTKSAEASFESIAALADALKQSDIANARSITAVAQALNAFKDKIGQTRFAPCKSIIDYELANKINNGGISDDPTTGTCMIKGICIRNFDSAKEYSSNFTAQEADIFAVSKEDVKEAEALSGETAPAPETRANNTDNAANAENAENNAQAETAPAENQQAQETQNKETTTEQPKQQQTGTLKAVQAANDIDQMTPDPDKVDQNINKHVEQGNIDTSAAKELDNGASVKLEPNQVDAIKDIKKPSDNLVKRKKNVGDSTEVDISNLSKLYEEINKIDWKESLDG